MFVPAIALTNVGHRTCPVAGAYIWKGLPLDITSSPSLLTFKQRPKMHLFRRCYPGLSF